jgi:hypothetical protein
MVVQLGVSQVFKWKVAQALQSGVDARAAATHFFEKRAKLILVHLVAMLVIVVVMDRNIAGHIGKGAARVFELHRAMVNMEAA